MKEFCQKDIEFQFMKLQNNCDIMIEIMKECHQEIEVTDMTGVTQSQSYMRSLMVRSALMDDMALDRVDEGCMMRSECKKAAKPKTSLMSSFLGMFSKKTHTEEFSSKTKMKNMATREVVEPSELFRPEKFELGSLEEAEDESIPPMVPESMAMESESMAMEVMRPMKKESLKSNMMSFDTAQKAPQNVFLEEFVKGTVKQLKKNK